MADNIGSEVTTALDESFSQMVKENMGFDIAPCGNGLDFEDKNRFAKLELSSAQKTHVSALMQQAPALMAVGTLAQAYTVSFPNGVPHVLTILKQGGFGSMVRGANGQFVASASFFPATAQAAFLGTFTAMSIASGQYFLAQINSKLDMIKLNLDKILEFLYGDKKAELMSEVSFVRYAYENYNSIMAHEHQRIASIVGLQESKKVAMKDIEFYMVDLDSTVNAKDNSGIKSVVHKAFQIKESLNLSMQLCVMSSLMEVYYAQNYDPAYIQYIETDMTAYIDKCEKRILGSFSVLNRRLVDYKGKLLEKVDTSAYEKQVGEVLDILNSGEEFAIRKSLHSVLHAVTQKAEYYLNNDGNVYIKTA